MTKTLNDLRHVFADAEPPDLWPEIERRAELDLAQAATVTHRGWQMRAYAAAAAAVIVSAVAAGALLSVTRGDGARDETINAAGSGARWTALEVPVLNWHLEYPDAWHVQVFQNRCMVGESGAVVTNLGSDLLRDAETPASSGGKFDGCSTGWDLDAEPPDFVGVEVTYRAGGRASSPEDHLPDTTRPLDLDSFTRIDDLTRYQAVTIGGEPRYGVRAWLGPDASANDIAAVRRLVSSITWDDPSPTSSTSVVTVPSVPLESVDWSAVQYPFECGTTRQGTVGWKVWDVAYPTPVDNVGRAVVLVTCNAGAGTPPVNLLVYDSATSSAAPHLAQVLIRSEDNWTANDVRVDGDQLALPAFGYSSGDIPRCCPDVTTTLTWQWQDGQYVATGSPPAHYGR